MAQNDPFPPIIYVTRDIERALGTLPLPTNFFIVANDTPYAREISREFPEQVFLIHTRDDQGDLLDTFEIISLPQVKEWLREKAGSSPRLLVFKNTLQIERLAAREGWILLNPSAKLADQIESKISQITWLGDDFVKKFLPPGTMTLKCGDVRWTGQPIVVQFAHSHTGEGTILVESEPVLQAMQLQFADREVRVSSFVRGPVFTSNNCMLADGKVLEGNISLQITGLNPFTELPFSTVGNDWTYANQFLTDKKERYREIVQAVSKKLSDSGWKGLFGIDVVLEEKTGQLFLIEINARQPASTTFESQLQSEARADGSTLNLFEAHLTSLLNQSIDTTIKLQEIKSGAQLIQRITKDIVSGKLYPEAEALRAKGLTVIEYLNRKPNSDLLRIQSRTGLIDENGKVKKDIIYYA